MMMGIMDNIGQFYANADGKQLYEVKLPTLSKEERDRQIGLMTGKIEPEYKLPDYKVKVMTKEQILRALHKQLPVRVSGNDGIFAIVEINLLLNTVGLVRLTDDDGIPDMTVGFKDIEVVSDDQD